MSSLNNLNIIAKTLGYIVKKQCGYYLVVRPDCRTGRQCDNLKDVADCLASMIRGQIKTLPYDGKTYEPSDSPEYWGKPEDVVEYAMKKFS